jgi:hypothetical protein
VIWAIIIAVLITTAATWAAWRVATDDRLWSALTNPSGDRTEVRGLTGVGADVSGDRSTARPQP